MEQRLTDVMLKCSFQLLKMILLVLLLILHFQPFASGRYKARGFKFKVNLTSKDPNQDIRVFELGYTAKIQRQEITKS